MARFACLLAAAGAILLAGHGASHAQALPPPVDAPVGDLSPAEIQRLFDAYAIVQAQDMLALSDAQYAQFVTRLKGLQETRRRNQLARNAMIQELRRLTQPDAPGDEPAIRDRLRALYDIDVRTSAELRKAYEAIDQILDVRQQARFRVFEERLERQKLDLLMRARQAQRPQPPGRRPLPQRPPPR